MLLYRQPCVAVSQIIIIFFMFLELISAPSWPGKVLHAVREDTNLYHIFNYQGVKRLMLVKEKVSFEMVLSF